MRVVQYALQPVMRPSTGEIVARVWRTSAPFSANGDRVLEQALLDAARWRALGLLPPEPVWMPAPRVHRLEDVAGLRRVTEAIRPMAWVVQREEEVRPIAELRLLQSMAPIIVDRRTAERWGVELGDVMVEVTDRDPEPMDPAHAVMRAEHEATVGRAIGIGVAAVWGMAVARPTWLGAAPMGVRTEAEARA
ncbi:protein of unknown function [Candidatus Hydrogenisulfobacillus filiaventi]|uniref:Uncharacterized protein n=1 Tax=Candidatus Hydrogenisulfobacillus filiaventi TaxID=2707344 RepID=A0A6F8ZHU1_9FIRM|nr:protein of unknown function [Candidatus Hydrogenisulfobacillus filiaventi]